jgi:hypothetical protein
VYGLGAKNLAGVRADQDATPQVPSGGLYLATSTCGRRTYGLWHCPDAVKHFCR